MTARDWFALGAVILNSGVIVHNTYYVHKAMGIQNSQMKQQIQALKPQFAVDSDITRDEVKVFLRNNGGGPAVIKSIHINNDDITTSGMQFNEETKKILREKQCDGMFGPRQCKIMR
jgi:hypothetical protein